MTHSFDKAKEVAKKDLEYCSTSVGIIAGKDHFIDLWARDSLFATFGAPNDIAQETIKTFLRFQRPDGLVPYRIFCRAGFLIPNFRSVQSGGLVLDGGLMTVIAANRLHDKEFITKHKHQLRQIIGWYKHRFGDDLLSEWFQCEWADAVYKSGKTLWTNILYWKATEDNNLKRKINETFWNGKYFSDWVDWRRHDYFASHPNMLAIVFGLATKKQAASIIDYAYVHCWNGWTLEENYPAYPWWRIPLQNYWAGVADYHNRGCLWLQPGILFAIALHREGRKKEATQILHAIAQKIVAYNGVFEVYEKDGRPVRRLLYRSEGPFAWSSGLFLFACRSIER